MLLTICNAYKDCLHFHPMKCTISCNIHVSRLYCQQVMAKSPRITYTTHALHGRQAQSITLLNVK